MVVECMGMAMFEGKTVRFEVNFSVPGARKLEFECKQIDTFDCGGLLDNRHCRACPLAQRDHEDFRNFETPELVESFMAGVLWNKYICRTDVRYKRSDPVHKMSIVHNRGRVTVGVNRS